MGKTQSHMIVDFMVQLPQEIVVVFLSFLPLADVLKCLRVSKQWNEVIVHLQPYWRAKTVGLGLSKSSLVKYKGLFSNHFVDLRGRLELLKSAKVFEAGVPVCYPWYSSQSCFIMPQQSVLVRALDSEFCSSCLQVEQLEVEGRVISTRVLCKKNLESNTSSVVWAHYSRNGCLYWVSDKFMATCYSPPKDECFTFSLLKEHVEVKSASDECMQGGKRNMSMVGCENCPLCVQCWAIPVAKKFQWGKAGNLETKESGAILFVRVLHLGDCKTAPGVLAEAEFKCSPDYRHWFKHDCRREMASIELMVSAETACGKESDDICSRHCALLHFNSHDVVIVVAASDKLPGARSFLPSLKVSFDLLCCKYELSERHGRMVMASGEEGSILIGCIADNRLYIWKVKKNSTNGLIACVSKAVLGIPLQSVRYAFDFVELETVGEQLCIAKHGGIIHCNPSIFRENNIYIFHSSTGKLLTQVSNWPPPHYSHLDCIHHFLLRQETRAWLHDIRAPLPPILFTMLYIDGKDRLGFLPVYQSVDKQEKKSAHAVNFYFEK